MNNIIKKIKNKFSFHPDLIIRKIRINLFQNVYIIFLETLCSQDRIYDYILKRITNIKVLNNINSIVPGSNLKKIDNYDEIEFYLYNGYTILIHNNKLFAIETKADITRSVNTPDAEPSLKGPKNAFVENYQTNIGLIKRRIKSHELKIKTTNIGKLSNLTCGLLYVNDIANKHLVDKAYNILFKIDTNFITDSEDLVKYISNKSVFPTALLTERPDRCADALTSGKIVIVCDESPNAIILPAYLIDFIHPFSDRYNKSININMTKIIRMICFILSIIIPSFYIAIINYNQEAIPSSLIINFSSQRSGVPFPSVIECIILLIICEILRESDLRFPSKYGSAVSVLGALVIGEAAVNAGLVSPIMIIITAFTYISSLIFSEIEINNAIRTYRFIFLIFASLFGLYGLSLSFILLIINLCDTYSLGYSYTFPISPPNKNYFKKVLLDFKKRKNT